MKYPYAKIQTTQSSKPTSQEAADLAGAQHREVSNAHDGGVPRMVIRGESLYEDLPRPSERYRLVTDDFGRTSIQFINQIREESHKLSAITDWLNCTFPVNSQFSVIEAFHNQFIEIVGPDFYPLIPRGKGLHGWVKSYELGKSKALMAIGGQRATAFLSLSGHACSFIHGNAWPQIAELLEVFEARISRWDGAVDNFDGQHSIKKAVELYQSGRFASGGNKPKCKQHGNWLEEDGTGRTLEIGSRKNGKLLRIYEKGKQLGDLNSPWVRWELELHNKDRIIPLDVLSRPGQYVAGSYKCMDWVNDETNRIRTMKNTAEISYPYMVEHAKRGYGKLLGVMLAVEGSPEKVIEKLLRNGLPKRLLIPNAEESWVEHLQNKYATETKES